MENDGIFKTPSGFLKIAHVVFGAVSVGIFGYFTKGGTGRNKYFLEDKTMVAMKKEIFFFQLVNFGFLLPSFLLLLTFLGHNKGYRIKKSLFEIVYHCFGFLFIFSASVPILVALNEYAPEFRHETAYGLIMTAGVCALLNSLAYAANAYTSYKLRPRSGN